MAQERLRILVAAYACSPARGSECGVGWGWVKSLARHHQLWVLVGAHFQEEIEAGLAREQWIGKSARFIYIPRLRLQLLERFWEPAYLWTYRQQWQRESFRVATALHEDIRFDLVHQLTYVGYRNPGYLWQLGIPFVWGPLGGLEQTPWRLLPAMGWHGCLFYLVRNLWNEFDRRFSTRPRRAFREAAELIAATTGIQNEILHFFGRQSTVVCEVGPPEGLSVAVCPRCPEEPLGIVWSGLHNSGKALPLLFRGLALLAPHVKWQLTILGSGPCTRAWQQLCTRLGLSDRCVWLGQLSREAALREMSAGHVFVITSLYDLTSTVLIEALANALPVICPDLYGFKDVITSDCGFAIPAPDPGSFVGGIRDALTAIYDNEPLRARLGRAALGRAASVSWEAKAHAVDAIYRTAMEKHLAARKDCGTLMCLP